MYSQGLDETKKDQQPVQRNPLKLRFRLARDSLSHARQATSRPAVRRPFPSSVLTQTPGNSHTIAFAQHRNLQRLPPLRPIPLEELEFDGHDISFFDDLDSLPLVWQTSNMDNVGELLIDFFRYFSKDFQYNSAVIAIRSELGVVTKDSKGWHTDVSLGVLLS